MTEPLALMAKDADDLAILSACLQDAIVMVGDMRYDAERRQFLMVLNRFCWERESGERVIAGLCIENVQKVAQKGIDQAKSSHYLELLALHQESDALSLIFGGGGAIRLSVTDLRLYLHDLDESWPTSFRPRHEQP
ncbi:MAG TPA: DUF2948 family protein [Dongiaceae bacterium]|jgi:hypothetical protein|nr:DUF2948 family protein [Dongiaceae bacterium]